MKKDSLEKKIAAYVTLAAAYLAAHPVDADAQIMYTDVNPDLAILDSLFLDLNNDGIVDFKLIDEYEAHIFSNGNSSGNGWSNFYAKILGFGSNQILFSNQISTCSNNPIPLDSGFAVGNINGNLFGTNSLLWEEGGHGAWSGTNSTSTSYSSGCFSEPNKFVGLKIITGGQIHYGWARLSVQNHRTILNDYAINLVPDSIIITGDNDGGCTSDSFNISPSVFHVLCPGVPVLLTLNNTYGESIQWQNHGMFIPDETDTAYLVTQPGLYTALVSDTGCFVNVNGATFYTDILDVSENHENEYCNLNNGTIDLSVNQNSSSISYHWNTGSNSQDLENLSSGVYEITVNSSNCNAYKYILITIDNFGEIPEPVIYQSGNILYTDEYAYYRWYYGNLMIPDSTNRKITIDKSGNYYVYVIDSFGCDGKSENFFYEDNFLFHSQSEDVLFNVNHKKLYFKLPDSSFVDYKIEIINTLGQITTSKNIDDVYPVLDLSDFPTGIYFFHIRSKQKIYSGKFFIE